jgi:hypothetical protein
MKIFEKIKTLGVFSSIDCLIKTIHLYYLQRKFGFDKWHVKADYSCKPYKKQVVDIVNSLPYIDVAVEVGCGLGDILNKTNVKNRIGIDIDQNAIECASLLRPNLNFYLGGLNDVEKYIKKKKNMVIMAINWTHNINFKDLVYNFSKVINEYSENCFIVVDIIKPNVKNYKYKHTIDDYEKYFKVCSSIDSVDEVRTFLTLSKL